MEPCGPRPGYFSSSFDMRGHAPPVRLKPVRLKAVRCPRTAPSACPAWTSTAITSRSRTRPASSATAPARRAFTAILDKWREPLRKLDEDPFGEKSSAGHQQEEADRPADRRRPGGRRAGAWRHRGIRAGARRRHPPLPARQGLARYRGHHHRRRLPERPRRRDRAGRAPRCCSKPRTRTRVSLRPIGHHPDDAGLIGALHLFPSWMIEAHDGIIAVDIGGTNIRAGVVASNLKKSPDLAKADVWKSTAVAACRRRALARQGRGAPDRHDRRPDRQGREGECSSLLP